MSHSVSHSETGTHQPGGESNQIIIRYSDSHFGGEKKIHTPARGLLAAEAKV